MADVYKAIGSSKEGIELEIFCSISQGKNDEYCRLIAENIADDVAEDIRDCADNENWNSSDVDIAVGRVLCKRLGIEL